MNAWGYVALGWGATAVVVGAYWLWIVRRTRRAELELERVGEQP